MSIGLWIIVCHTIRHFCHKIRILYIYIINDYDSYIRSTLPSLRLSAQKLTFIKRNNYAI